MNEVDVKTARNNASCDIDVTMLSARVLANSSCNSVRRSRCCPPLLKVLKIST